MILAAFAPLAGCEAWGALRESAPYVISPATVLVGFALLSWLRPAAGLAGLVALFPCLVGLRAIALCPFDTVDLALSGAFIGWSIRRQPWRHSIRLPWAMGVGGAGLCAVAWISLLRTLSAGGLLAAGAPWMGTLFSLEDTRFCLSAATFLIGGMALGVMLMAEIGEDRIVAADLSLLPSLWLPQLAGFALLQLATGIPRPYMPAAVSSPFQDIHAFGSVAVVELALLLAGYGATRRLPHRIQVFLAAVLCLASFSRVTWIAAAGVMLAALVPRLPRRGALAVAIALAAAVLCANLAPRPAAALKDNTYARRAWSALNLRALFVQDELRQNLFQRAWVIMRSHPWGGIGIGAFRRLSFRYAVPGSPESSVHEFAHDIFLQIGAELGVPAVVFFGLILASPLKRGMRRPEFIAAAAYLVTQLTSTSLLIYPGQSVLFFLLLAALAADRGRQPA